MNRFAKFTLGLLLAGYLGTEASLGARVPHPSDRAIAQRLERKLQRKFPDSADKIDMTIRHGEVTLAGVVRSLPEKHRIEEVTATLWGVTSVRNNLSVAPSPRSDRQIAQDIRDSFRESAPLKKTDIRFAVTNDVVTLSGTAPSFAEKWIAAQICANIKGVRQVNNRVIFEYAEDRTDQEILADIKGRIAWDSKIDGGRIFPKVRNGYVTVTGSVDTPIQKMWARYDSWVAGVKGLDDTGVLVVNLSPSGEKGERVQMTDSAIRQAIQNSFLYQPNLSLAIRVSVDAGIVTLSGTIDTLANKRLAAQVASEIAGVRQVRNLLRVTPGSAAGGDLVKSVREAFQRDPYVDNPEIHVEQRDRATLLLSGHVDSTYERNRAESIAAGTPGVVSVIDDLRVGPENPVYFWKLAKNTRPAKQADLALFNEVRDDLDWSGYPGLGQLGIAVDAGVVTLTGYVNSAFLRRAAEDTAYEAGALRVRNKVVVKTGSLDAQ